MQSLQISLIMAGHIESKLPNDHTHFAPACRHMTQLVCSHRMTLSVWTFSALHTFCNAHNPFDLS